MKITSKQELIALGIWIPTFWYFSADIWTLTRYLVSHPLAYALAFYWLYLVYCGGYKRPKDRGEEIPFEAMVINFPVVLYGYLLDLGWRLGPGTLQFGFQGIAPRDWLDWPWRRQGWNPLEWTFTAQLKSWKNDYGWRGKQARWFAKMLNYAEEGDHV